MHRPVCLACLVLMAFGSARSAAAPEPLPSYAASPEHPFGFRGDGSGRFPNATPTTDCSLKKNVRWSALVGASYSSPILTAQYVVVASEPDLIVCLNRADGKEQWRLPTTAADVPSAAGRKSAEGYIPPKSGSGFTAATPVTDGQCIYAVFANGIVRAIGIDGKPKWTMCIEAPQSTAYGRAASPLLIDGKLIVHMTALYAFDSASGKQLWVNMAAKSSYATPISLRIGADRMIVTPGGDVVRAADGVTVVAGIGMSQQASPIVDANGTIYFPNETVSAIQLGPNYKDSELWNASGVGDTLGSPLIIDNTFLIVNSNGELFAFDANGKGELNPLSGARPIIAPGEGTPAVYSSLTLAGKYLFLYSNSGEMVVLDATRAAKQVAKNQLGTGSGASPVFSGKHMFLRDGQKLLCIGE